jgi:hypothetical protein
VPTGTWARWGGFRLCSPWLRQFVVSSRCCIVSMLSLVTDDVVGDLPSAGLRWPKWATCPSPINRAAIEAGHLGDCPVRLTGVCLPANWRTWPLDPACPGRSSAPIAGNGQTRAIRNGSSTRTWMKRILRGAPSPLLTRPIWVARYISLNLGFARAGNLGDLGVPVRGR